MTTGPAATKQLTERGSLVFRCGLLDEPPVSLGLLSVMARAAALATSVGGFDVRAEVDLFETRFSVLGGDPAAALAALRRHLDSPDPAAVAAAAQQSAWRGPSLVERCWRALFGATGPGALSLGRPGESTAAREGFAAGAAMARVWFAPDNVVDQAQPGDRGAVAAFPSARLPLPGLPEPLRPLPRAVRDGADGCALCAVLPDDEFTEAALEMLARRVRIALPSACRSVLDVLRLGGRAVVTVGAVGPEPDVRWFLPVLAENVRVAGQYGPGASERGGHTLADIRRVGDRLLALIDEGIVLGPGSIERFADGVQLRDVEHGPAPVTGKGGRVFVRPLLDPNSDQLVLDGSTLVYRRKDQTIAWIDLSQPAAAETWPDGRWRVTAPDGEWITIVPLAWRGGASLCRRIALLIPSETVVTHDEPDTEKPANTLSARVAIWLRLLGAIWAVGGALVYLLLSREWRFGVDPTAVAVLIGLVIVLPPLGLIGVQELDKRWHR